MTFSQKIPQKAALAFVFSLLLLVLVAGCKDPDPPQVQEDVKDPWIIMSSPQVVPMGQFIELGDGETFPVDIRFEDDVELKSYRIEIRYDESLNYLKKDNDFWEKVELGLLDGPSDGVNTTFQVATDPSAGPYQFIVTVTDMAGKSDTLVTYLRLTNQRDTTAPAVNITMPATFPDPMVEVDTVEKDTLWVKGLFSDNLGVKDAYLRVRTSDSILVSGSELWLDTLFAGAYNLDTFLLINAASPGDHLFESFVYDGIENVTRTAVPIYIKNP